MEWHQCSTRRGLIIVVRSPALDKKPVYQQLLNEMEVVTPVVSREHFGIGTIVDRSYIGSLLKPVERH